MSKFIKLTHYEGVEDVYVSAESVIAAFKDHEGDTVVMFYGGAPGGRVIVEEDPSEVISRVEHVLGSAS